VVATPEIIAGATSRHSRRERPSFDLPNFGVIILNPGFRRSGKRHLALTSTAPL